MTAMLVALASALAVQLGPSLHPFLYILIAAALTNLTLFVIPWGDHSWHVVTNWEQPGLWLATIPAIEHEVYNARGRQTSATLELLGTAHFTSRGFEWTLNGTYDGVRHVVWTRDWQMTARRSLGWIPQYEIAFFDPVKGRSQTLWLLRSKGFIPS